MDENMIQLLLKDQAKARRSRRNNRSWPFRCSLMHCVLSYRLLGDYYKLVMGRLKVVGFNLEGVVADWFWWMAKNELITDWVRFVKSVRNRFGPSKYDDPQRALSKLLQTRSVKDYQQKFIKLMNMVTDIPDSLIISFYISWLKLDLQRELLDFETNNSWCHVFIQTFYQSSIGRQGGSCNGPGSSYSLKLWERIGIGDIQELMDNGDNHYFVQRKVGERVRLQAMVAGRPYQWVRGLPKEAMWEWMPDSQSAYSQYHLEGKVNFEGVRNVTRLAAGVERRKRVKCYVQGSRRRKRKKGVGCGSESLDSTRISC
uniref:Ty3/gypsy retrotransposon protein n=1 Tax=Tanacetum cinerariifolium TaxID=118510 RepID=A0A6L2P1G5_TANCI|nr:Ty3/gypsy retrotransposon protein [Tanacetum cinerariifolium]